MKKLNLILIIAIGIFMFSCKSAPTTDEALKCNKFIMNCTSDIDNSYSTFKDAWNEYDIDTYDADAFEVLKTDLQSVQEKVKSSLITVKDNKEYEGIKDFTDYNEIAVDYYKTIGSMCDNEYTEIIALIGKGDDFTSEDRVKCFANDSIISEKHKKACDTFIKFQEDFAKKYNFGLEDKSNK